MRLTNICAPTTKLNQFPFSFTSCKPKISRFTSQFPIYSHQAILHVLEDFKPRISWDGFTQEVGRRNTGYRISQASVCQIPTQPRPSFEVSISGYLWKICIGEKANTANLQKQLFSLGISIFPTDK